MNDEGHVSAGLAARLDCAGRHRHAYAWLDDKMAPKPGGDLSGLVLSVKDNINVRGMPTRCGSPALPERPATADAEAVAKLRRAGMGIIGKTAMSEFAYVGMHPALPPTPNPWDPSRSSGGSTRGGAISVALGSADVALGTDTGGSVRVPAANCGVVGLKPTAGRLSRRGVVLLSPSLDHVGLLARRIEDVAAAFAALAPDSSPSRAPAPSFALLRCRRAERDADPEVADVAQRALDDLARAVPLAEARPEGFDDGNALAMILICREASRSLSRLAREGVEDFSEAIRALATVGAVLPDTLAERIRARALALVEAIDAALANTGYLVSMTTPIQPRRVGDISNDLVDFPETRLTAPFNLTGHPAISVPCGLTRSGLPVGLQIVGRRGNDWGVIHAAGALMRTCGLSFQPPPGAAQP